MNKKAVLGSIFGFFFMVLVLFVGLAAFSPMIDNISESTRGYLDPSESPFLTLLMYLLKPLVWFIALLATVLMYIVYFGGGASSGQQ
jgi:hypothetical protein